jgi:hypothetical protein
VEEEKPVKTLSQDISPKVMNKASKEVDKTSYKVYRASIDAGKGGRKRENLRRQTQVLFKERGD